METRGLKSVNIEWDRLVELLDKEQELHSMKECGLKTTKYSDCNLNLFELDELRILRHMHNVSFNLTHNSQCDLNLKVEGYTLSAYFPERFDKFEWISPNEIYHGNSLKTIVEKLSGVKFEIDLENLNTSQANKLSEILEI